MICSAEQLGDHHEDEKEGNAVGKLMRLLRCNLNLEDCRMLAEGKW